MLSIKLDLIWTIFWVFCSYSLYTPIVAFMWEEKGQRVFQNLRIPVVVFLYFLVPCVALFLLNTAFSGIQQLRWEFAIATGFVLSLSFFLMLYILTVPDWPVGKFLQIDKVPVSVIRTLLSVNFAGSLLIAIACSVIIIKEPQAIQQQGKEQVFQELKAHRLQLDKEKSRSSEAISEILNEARTKVFDDYIKSAQGVLTLFTSVVALLVSLRTLGSKKKGGREEEAGESEPAPQETRRRILVMDAKIKILFFASNPEDVTPLNLDEEIRSITTKIRASDYRDVLDLISRWAVRPDDLLQELNTHKPTVVHFSGHSSSSGELVLMDDLRQAKTVSPPALKALFSTLKDNIRLVVLNACYSKTQAEAIVQVIDCVIGMNTSIGDNAAIAFAASLYRAIGFGRSVQDSFDQGKVSLMLEGIPEENTPEMLVRNGVDPALVFLVDSR